jgi:predicted nucleic acid-binding protein
MSHVIDASSLLTLIKQQAEHAHDTLKQGITVPLIYYEIGNALRTSAVHLKHITPEEAESTLENLHKALALVTITPQDNIQDSNKILQNSIKYNLSYYDSAYITSAIKHNASLLTEDNKLAKAAKRANIITTSIDTP